MELALLQPLFRKAQFKSFSRGSREPRLLTVGGNGADTPAEEELDTRLFDRAWASVVALTDTGERFLSHACDVMESGQSGAHVGHQHPRQSCTVRRDIGTIESLACLKRPTVPHLYRKFNPKVSIRITVGEPEDLIEHMETRMSWT